MMKLLDIGYLIATGSIVAGFPVPGLKDSNFLTSDDVLELRQTPKSMVVLGAGPVAVELAQFFCRIGTRTTLIQRSNHILSKGDADLAHPVETRFREEGMELYTGTKLLRVESSGNSRTTFFTHEGNEKAVTSNTNSTGFLFRLTVSGEKVKEVNSGGLVSELSFNTII